MCNLIEDDVRSDCGWIAPTPESDEDHALALSEEGLIDVLGRANGAR
eukprot:CAMPEP_0206045872 /NCGR_PEP_ID=MMETSP1466-20131121/17072_1 /ASSEMBLY_ACC=CAM_ASM_001126 /TAXON_ID=44452 /ORGANISM="Pavlova gyrans, Strain CCMP608" /LENGTH=46 /DNA_ID= /DNA_START= /DNA_END= /DNA_ORIENTATION=